MPKKFKCPICGDEMVLIRVGPEQRLVLKCIECGYSIDYAEWQAQHPDK